MKILYPPISYIQINIELYGQITHRPGPEFCPHFARRRTHLHSWERHFLIILGGPGMPKFYSGHSQIASLNTFSSSSGKNSKNNFKVYRLPEIGSFFCNQLLPLIFQKIHQTSSLPRFLRGQNRMKK